MRERKKKPEIITPVYWMVTLTLYDKDKKPYLDMTLRATAELARLIMTNPPKSGIVDVSLAHFNIDCDNPVDLLEYRRISNFPQSDDTSG